METERTIASMPARTVGDTCDRLLELAAAWGGAERVGDLSPATPIIRALVVDRILRRSPLAIGYGPHILRLFCEYEDEALEITQDDEDLPSNLPHPGGSDVSWTLVAPCPETLLAWATAKVQEAGISSWFVAAGPDGKKPKQETKQATTTQVKGAHIKVDALQRLIDKKRS